MYYTIHIFVMYIFYDITCIYILYNVYVYIYVIFQFLIHLFAQAPRQ